MIDHTLLKPEATEDEIRNLCAEALQYSFASVCVNPCYVSLCHELLNKTVVKVCTVVSFPLGATTTESKCFEAGQALQNGAQEIDMVMHTGRLKQGNFSYVFNDINKVVLTVKKYNAICKVILETSLLTDEEKVKGCLICKAAKADFVKTSTGFSNGGATIDDVSLMRNTVGPDVGVKASGGIYTFENAVKMITYGANRIGTSAGVKIITGRTSKKEGC
ncbi:MAG: deoxyribose-phosphate aldolase [Ignavibacteria bacterium]